MMASRQEQQRPPPPSVQQDTMKKIMWLYRTRTCPLNKRNQCNYGLRCFDSHDSQPERRPPKQNEYNDWHPSTMKCTSNADESCKYGRACYFAHNDVEVNYHPTMYKTKPCAEFEKNGHCQLGMICPNFHYPDEQRKIEKGSLPADCKSDGVSRKAPPPQEFRRWLDEELRIAKATKATNNIDINNNNNNNNGNVNGKTSGSNSLIINNGTNSINNNDIGNINNESNINIQSDNIQNETMVDNNSENVNNLKPLQMNQSGSISTSKTTTPSPSNHTGNSNGIENEVEIELPSSHQSQSQSHSHSHSDLNLMLKNTSDSVPSSHHSSQPPSTRSHSQFANNAAVSSAASSPYVEPWPQQQNGIGIGIGGNSNNGGMKYNNQSRAEQYLPSTSPHLLNRANSTPSSLPSVPHSNHISSPNLVTLSQGSIPGPTSMHHAHSYGGPPSAASHRSNRSNRSSGGRSARSLHSTRSGKSKRNKNKRNRMNNNSHHNITRKQLEDEEKQSLEIVKSYKVTRCVKSKCNNVYCDNYHDWRDRRRSPLSFNYSSTCCPRIFDPKTRRFNDNCYGCPFGDKCEFAHNYLEIWYHPNIFHTKYCPIIKYQKKCLWGFKCSHYHSKYQKRTTPVTFNGLINNHNNVNINNHIQSHVNDINLANNNNNKRITSSSSYPPNLPIMNNTNNRNHIHGASPGPHRPPLTTRSKMPQQINSPYSAVPFDAQNHFNSVNINVDHHHQQQMQQQQQQQQQMHHSRHPQQHQLQQNQRHSLHHQKNGLVSPQNKGSPHDTTYSFNPLMQGIAPSINSWRQKIDNNPTY